VTGRLNSIAAAAEGVDAAFAPDSWSDAARDLTCTEVEALAELFRSVGLLCQAAWVVEAHHEGDEPGDLHYTP
jgi:hypothetical protein